MTDEAAPGETLDGFFGRRVLLRQFRRGHRAGLDAALLAAAAPAAFSGLALDVGAGSGAVGLALAATRPGARVGLIECDPASAALARENIALNGLGARVQAHEADALAPRARRAAGLKDEAADLVLSNPPFLDPARARASPDADRRRAHMAPDGGAARWTVACLALARPGGDVMLIDRPERLGGFLAALEGRAGAAVLKPVYPRAGAAAIRVLLRARKGARTPLAIAPGLVLHDDEGGFTREAQALLAGEDALAWGDAR
ncbi:tRNA1(Val) (adenine(37)-N6)-methyltransferase [Methylocella sp.]|uniref:tRNA1(Val) (adenine(37)-N6)-methyltransferase n=1 Tax=Methylocella sp. TaxID=1978226 RepID=UPI0037844D2E